MRVKIRKGIFVVLGSLAIIWLAACGGGQDPNTPSLSFAAPNTLKGDNPYAVALRDLDHDGFLDLIAPSGTGSSTTLRIYYGDSEGTYQRSANTDIGTWSGYITISDNAVGASQIFVSDNAVNLGCTVNVFDLQSDASAGFRASFSTGRCTIDYLVAVDLNRDGVVDVVSDEGEINLGQSDGTFALAYKPAGMTGGSTASGDWNEDGNTDLVSFDNAGTVYVYIGHGDGTFASPVPVSAPNDGSNSSNGEIKVADINTDGTLDLVAHNGSLIFAFIGNGDGTFRSGVKAIENAGNIVISFTVADLTLDGYPDMAVSEPNRTQAVQIYAGDGSGVFKSLQGVDVGYADVGAIQADDLDKDGRPDLVTANRWNNTLSVVRNTTALP